MQEQALLITLQQETAILAALDFYQKNVPEDRRANNSVFYGQHARVEPMTDEQIDEMCEQLSCGYLQIPMDVIKRGEQAQAELLSNREDDAMSFETYVRLQNLARLKGLDLNFHFETQEAAEKEEPDAVIVETLDRKGFLIERPGSKPDLTYGITFEISDPDRVEKWIKEYTPAN